MSFRRHEGVAVCTKWACGESLLSATRPLCAYQAVGLKDIRGFYGFCIKVYGRYLRQTQPCFQLIHVFLRLFIALCCSLFKPKHFINRGSKHIETMGLTEENHAKSHLTSTVMNMSNGRCGMTLCRLSPNNNDAFTQIHSCFHLIFSLLSKRLCATKQRLPPPKKIGR